MSHPTKRIRHPVLTRIRKLVKTWPETAEVEAWGHPTFRAGKKMFASFGESDDGVASMGIKQTHADQTVLVQSPGFFLPKYVTAQGWIGIRPDEVSWDVIAELLERGYRLVALKRMIKALDGE